MASVQITVENSDEQLRLEVDPPPAIGARFDMAERQFEVIALQEGDGDEVRATVRQVDGA